MHRAIVLLILAAVSTWGQPKAETNSALTQKIEAALKKSGAPSVSVAVVERGKLTYARAFGSADLAARRPARVNTRYAIGSISKQFTAAALLLLQEQGKLSLDDKVSRWFPNLTRANDITIRQLLSHTAGYEDYAPQDYIIPAWTSPIAPEGILDRWAKKPLSFEPGTKWQYSNTGYVLAAAIFEKAAGQGLVAFLREKIFQPLEMQSPVDWAVTPPGPDDATAYTRYALGPPRPARREAPSWYFGAAQLAMTPSDLARWDIAFLEKKILSGPSYDEFTREVKLKDGGATRYALGLTLGEINGTPVVQHGGEVSGFLASNMVFPKLQGALVVLSNQDCVGFTSPLAREIATLVFAPEKAAGKNTEQVRGILDGLRNGKIDRALFTADANSYFSETALKDCRNSLRPLGKLKTVAAGGENLRGGMTHRSYRAEFEKKTLNLNIYVTA
ncbi:MAG TPA: serine hydrolase domain-containing protein, partial [Bryobacteraceae bacterium]